MKVEDILIKLLNSGWSLDEFMRPQEEYDEEVDQAKLALAKLFHEVVPEKKEIGVMSTSYRFGKATQHSLWCYNEAIDQTHKNIDEMFK